VSGVINLHIGSRAVSYFALLTDRYDEMVRFYGEDLGLEMAKQWDRPNARGVRFDLGGVRLELIDNQRERNPLSLGTPADRFHVVIEVDDIEVARQGVKIDAPAAQPTSWGAETFELHDPDGIRVTFLQWIDGQGEAS
jgi:catechol 2,3-dioxygenase-like lactoylglutathione lyase family enzyme